METPENFISWGVMNGNTILDLAQYNMQRQLLLLYKHPCAILSCTNCNLSVARADATDTNRATEDKLDHDSWISPYLCKLGTEKVKYICGRCSPLNGVCCIDCCKRYLKRKKNLIASTVFEIVQALKIDRTSETIRLIALTECQRHMYTEKDKHKFEKFGLMEKCIKTRQLLENTKDGTTLTITKFAFVKPMYMLRQEITCNFNINVNHYKNQLKGRALIRDIDLIEPYPEHLLVYCINAQDDRYEQCRQILENVQTIEGYRDIGFRCRNPRNKDTLIFLSEGGDCEKESVDFIKTYRKSMVTPYIDLLCKDVLGKELLQNTILYITDMVIENQLKRRELIRDIDLIEPYCEHLFVYCIIALDDRYEQFRQILENVQTIKGYSDICFRCRNPRNKDTPIFLSEGGDCEKESVDFIKTYRKSMVTPNIDLLCKDVLGKELLQNTILYITDMVIGIDVAAIAVVRIITRGTMVDDVCKVVHGYDLFWKLTLQYCLQNTPASMYSLTGMLNIYSHNISIVREMDSSLAAILHVMKAFSRLSIVSKSGNHVASLNPLWERRTCDNRNYHLLEWLMHYESASSWRFSPTYVSLNRQLLLTSNESILSDGFVDVMYSLMYVFSGCHKVEVGTHPECLASLNISEASCILMVLQMIPSFLLRPIETIHKLHGAIKKENEENIISYRLVKCLCLICCKMTNQNSALKAGYFQRDEVVHSDNLRFDSIMHHLNKNSDKPRGIKIAWNKTLILSCCDQPEIRFQNQMIVQKLISYSYYLSNIRVSCDKKVDRLIEGGTYNDSDIMQSRPLENVRVPSQHLYCQKETSNANIRTAPQDLKQIKVCSDMTYRQQTATYGILDLKRKTKLAFMIKKDQAKTKSRSHKETDKHPNHVKFSKTDEIDDITKTIRSMTWLPLDQLPVPEVDITLALVFDPLDSMFQMMAQGDTPGPEVTMRYELLRLCTLRNYPKNNKPYIIRLAGAGFYFAAEGDEVVCYCCGMRKSSWVENDSPHAIHESLSPRCSFLIRNAEVNVPVPKQDRPGRDRFSFIKDPEVPKRSASTGNTPINTCNNTNHRINENAATNITVSQALVIERTREIGANHSNTSRTIVTTSNNHQTVVSGSSETQIATTTSHYRGATSSGVNAEIPKHPTYAVKSVRIASFEGWPNNTGQTVMVMVEAGYYFSGVGDGVRCFFCGIGLRHWTAEDDPWIEHARWSRNCIYLKTVKGEEYISLVHLAMQFTDDNNAGAAANQIPIEEINTIFLTGAAQSVLEMGHEPKLIKQAIGMILKDIGRTGISSEKIMAKVLDIKHNASQKDVTGQLNRLHLQIATPEHTAATAKTQSQHIPRNQNNSNQPEEKNAAATSMSKHVQNPICNKRSVGQSLNKQDNKTTKDPKLLKAENDIMLKQTMCKVCMDNTVSIVFLPCGHLVTCTECAPAMRKCPICRKLIKGTVKAFMS